METFWLGLGLFWGAKMYTEKEWLRSICENPADDQLRLVFADWLEEQGNVDRAAYIRREVLHPDDRPETVLGPSNHLMYRSATVAKGYRFLKGKRGVPRRTALPASGLPVQDGGSS